MNTTQDFLDNIAGIGASDQEKLEMLSVAINAWNNCFVVTDAGANNFSILYANRGFERLTGYNRDDFIGRNCRFLQGEDRDQEGLEPMRLALATGAECVTTLRNYRKNGDLFYNEVYLSPIHSPQGELRYYVGVQNDITQRVQHEQNLRTAVEDSLQDASWLTETILDKLNNIRNGHVLKDMPEFTAREREVLERIAQGQSNRTIANELGLSVNTIRNYVNNLYGKLSVNSRPEAIIWARTRGMG